MILTIVDLSSVTSSDNQLKAISQEISWQHQAITWTVIDLSSVMSSYNHLRSISQEIYQPSIIKIGLKIIYLKFH